MKHAGNLNIKKGFNFFIIVPYCVEISIDPDQLASEKPADQDPLCFPLCLLYMLIIGIVEAVIGLKLERGGLLKKCR